MLNKGDLHRKAKGKICYESKGTLKGHVSVLIIGEQLLWSDVKFSRKKLQTKTIVNICAQYVNSLDRELRKFRYVMVPIMAFCFGFDALTKCNRRDYHVLSKRVQPHTAVWLEMSMSKN